MLRAELAHILDRQNDMGSWTDDTIDARIVETEEENRVLRRPTGKPGGRADASETGHRPDRASAFKADRAGPRTRGKLAHLPCSAKQIVVFGGLI